MAGLDAALAGVTRWIGINLLIDTVRIALPGVGEPVLNTTTGELEYPEGDVLYEGAGAVVPGSATTEGLMTSDASHPWAQLTRAKFILLTPLEAPIPPQNAIASVVQVHDPARTSLIGRTWLCVDQGLASTVEVVRRTALDQNRAAEGVA